DEISLDLGDDLDDQVPRAPNRRIGEMVAPRFMSGATYSFIFAFIKTIRLLRLLLANPRGHLGGKARGRDSPRQVLVHAQDMQMSTWTSQCNGHVPRGKGGDAGPVRRR